MRKAIATCVYTKTWENEKPVYQVWSFTVNVVCTGNIITLVSYDTECGPQPYKYETLNSLYGSLLRILKNNGYYVSYYTDFGKIWYNIQFIELNHPEIKRFGYSESEDL